MGRSRFVALAVSVLFFHWVFYGRMENVQARSAQAMPDSIDPFINFTRFCDFGEHAAMSNECYGFIAAVVEMKREDDVLAELGEMDHYQRSCIPRGARMDEIFQKIRPLLRSFTRRCVGQCSSASYVATALNAAYPCKP